MKIGVFGGSFNPVHFGHVGIARHAVEALQLDRLIVVPAATSPFKTERPIPEFFSRLEMVGAAFAEVPKAEVDLREIERGGVSYAIDTVREIAAENPGAKLYFIIGEDSVEGLPRWKDIDQLRQMCEFVAYPRTKESSTEIRGLFERSAVVENEDTQLVATVRRGLVAKGGFCPCRLAKTAEFFCPCDEFKAQLADGNFHGLCHCRLYRKP